MTSDAISFMRMIGSALLLFAFEMGSWIIQARVNQGLEQQALQVFRMKLKALLPLFKLPSRTRLC